MVELTLLVHKPYRVAYFLRPLCVLRTRDRHSSGPGDGVASLARWSALIVFVEERVDS